MAQLTGVGQTYQDPTRREDLLDKISDVSPDKNYLSTILKKTTASQTLHEWGNYYQSRPTDNSAKTVEGDEDVFADLTAPTRKSNICQIIKEKFAVSGTQLAVDKISPKDGYAREMGWAMSRFKTKQEFALIRGTKASGSSGVAREMHGIRNWIVDEGKYTVRASGTSLSETEFNNMIGDSWDVTDESVVDLILTTGPCKRDISKFTAGNTKNISAEDKRLVNTISIYESDYGVHEIRAHKDMASNEVMGVKKDNLAIAYLRKPKHEPLGLSGDNKKGHIVGEMTVEVMGAVAMVLRTGYNLR